MPNCIHPITLEAATEVASSLSPDDYREVTEGYGLQTQDVIDGSLTEDSYYFESPNGKIAAIGGVEKDGLIWMLCTPLVEQYSFSFVRACKQMLNSRNEPLLWNIVDKRNTVHLKLLKFLGFKFEKEISYGPNNLPFIKFYKC